MPNDILGTVKAESAIEKADVPEPYSAEVGLRHHIEQAHAISHLLEGTGLGPCSLVEGVQALVVRLTQAESALAAEVRRYQERRCRTCKYSHWPGPGRMACKLYRCMVTPDHGCLAWEKRDEA